MEKQEENDIKKELLSHLSERLAFTPLKDFIDDIPFDKLGIRPDGLPYSFYEVFAHICFAQKDIMEFVMAKNYNLPSWPKDYWPQKQAPSSEKEWDILKQSYQNDLNQLTSFLDRDSQILTLVKHATNDKQTLLREVLLLIDHLSYHTGQLMIIARLLGVKK